MPRRDGFPTNRELQVDFTTAARDVFVVAVERELEAKMPPACEGKPLSFLYLKVWKNYELDTNSPQVVEAEQLWVDTLDEEDLKSEFEVNEILRDTPKDAQEYYLALGRRIGLISLSDATRFRQVVLPEVTNASWDAWTQSGPNRQAGTLRERPSKQSLVAARYFVDQAMDYVQSDAFLEAPEVRRENYRRGYSQQNPEFEMMHQLSFRISPDLPLNGHESRRFLKDYADAMYLHFNAARQRAQRLSSQPVPNSFIIRLEAEKAARYSKAFFRAQKFLAD